MTQPRPLRTLAPLTLLAAALAACTPGPARAADGGLHLDQVKSEPLKVKALTRMVATGDEHAAMQLEVIDREDGAPKEKALRVTVTEGKTPWSMGMVTPVKTSIAKDDVLLATFEMRCPESMTGQALVNFIFQGGAPDYKKSAMVRVAAGGDWTRISLPFRAAESYKPGDAMAGFHLALADQTVEFAGLRVLNYGPDFDLAALTSTDLRYEGHEADAPWRAQAQAMIDQNRKADLTVTVRNAAGQPVKDASVSVEMTRHAFRFGTAVAVSKILLDSPDGERYRQELNNNFNAAVFESAMKWNNYGTGTPAQIAESLKWLTAHDIITRGHVLMWPSWRWVDPKILPLKEDPVAFRKAIEDRVTGMVSLYKDTIQDWDVVNEAYGENDILKMYGDAIMVDWFKLAHEANPNAVLYVNDNDMVTTGGQETKHQAAYEQMIQDLLDAGAPVGGIGMQGHFSATLTAPKDVWKVLDRFGKFNLPIQITEFDVNDEDRQVQADYQRDFLTAAFAHPTLDGFTMWGFWEGQHWRPNAAMFDKQWNLRPHGQVWRDLVYGQWWTRESGQTGDQGQCTVRGFLGDYQITVTGPDGIAHEAAATLDKSGQQVVITLGG